MKAYFANTVYTVWFAVAVWRMGRLSLRYHSLEE